MVVKGGKKNVRKVRIEHSAGGVVFQRSGRGVLIGFIFDPYRKWGFAKGHIEKTETVEQAAKRETQEEMGILRLRIVASLGTVTIRFYERYRHGKPVIGPRRFIQKDIQYFLMQTPSGARTKPERGERIRAIRWAPLSHARRILSYKNAQPILERAIYIIKNQKNTSTQNPLK